MLTTLRKREYRHCAALRNILVHQVPYPEEIDANSFEVEHAYAVHSLFGVKWTYKRNIFNYSFIRYCYYSYWITRFQFLNFIYFDLHFQFYINIISNIL